MKAFVTGGTGFMGSAVVRALLDDGQEVKALAREGSDQRNLKGLDLEVVRGDITDRESIRSAMKGCDTVYHLAAQVDFWLPPDQLHRFYEVNVEGTKNVMSAALDQGVSRVVYTSTISTIGANGKDRPTTEENSFNLWNMCMDYERSKYSAEFETWRFAARGLPVVAVLPAAPLGARDIKPNPIGQLILDYLSGKVPAYMVGGGNFIDADDLGLGHVLAGRVGKPGERYILGSENLATVDFFKMLEDVSGVRAPSLRLPYSAALAAAHLLESISNRVTKKPPLLTVPLIQFSSKYYFADTSKAKKELGFQPRSTVQRAAIKAIEWFLDNGYLKVGPKAKGQIRQHLEVRSAGSAAA
jgi:dihydroflavonol-4-reductase